MTRDVLTPQGVVLRLDLARAGDRAIGFVLDSMFLTVASVVVVLGFIFLVGLGRMQGIVAALLLLILFVVRNFWFTFFELRWRGQTPGKRIVGTRVIDRRGGPLTPEAVLVRNLTRDIEVFLPLTVLFAPRLFSAGASPWVGLLAGAWAVVFGFLPLFNRDRLRIGDLIAGTLVVRAPRVLLVDDLAVGRSSAPEHSFTPAQLDIYGIYELQTLEAVLRRGAGPSNRGPLVAVAERIQRKIGWQPVAGDDPHWFLRDFYAALRARLEQRLSFGERRERKRLPDARSG